jgi:hypothetical protein
MKPRTLLILLSIVLVLGAFIWFYERTLPSSEERAELGKKVFRLDKGDVTAVTIDSTKGSVRLERVALAKREKPRFEKGAPPPSSSEWHLVKPLATRADAFAVDRLLEAVASLEKSRTLEGADPKAVGLDKPRATVRLTTKKGETVLRLGAEVPPGGNLVAGVDGRKETYVVADTILTEADRNPLDWRDRQMVHGDREDVERVTLTGAVGGPVVLVRHPQGFRIEKPVADRADRELTEGLLADLTGLMAERFVPTGSAGKSAADLGLAAPRETVEVTFKGAPPLRIELGNPVTGTAAPEGQTAGELTYTRIGDALFEARTRLAEAARRAPAAWQAVQLSGFEVYQVESATVQDGATALQLTRDGTDWKRGGTLISFLSVSDLLSVLTSAKATRLLPSAEAQSAKPLLGFTLHTKEGDETLTIYPEQKEGVPARASGRDAVLMLSAETLKQIQAKVQDVKTAKPVKPEKAEKGKK